jgi:agmatine deiminase
MNGSSPRRPNDFGLVMPAEFEPHAGCLMAWPVTEAVFGAHLEAAREQYAAVARAVRRFEPLTMIARPDQADQARKMCGPDIDVWPLPLDDSWTRDTGPTFVRTSDGRIGGVDWRFNGWGGVWPDHDQDKELAGRVLDRLGMARFEAGLVLEGGAIHVDGRGTLMAVKPCLLDPNRNPDWTLADLEKALTDYLGVRRFIWLEYGLADDETAGHVDNVACFARPGVVLAHDRDDPADVDYPGVKANLKRLAKSRDADGRTLEVVPIKPPAVRYGKNGRLTLSYINFYLPNGGVVLPAFNDPKDRIALEVIKQVFPDREAVQVPVLDILHGGGGIHCITQQVPSGPPLEAKGSVKEGSR